MPQKLSVMLLIITVGFGGELLAGEGQVRRVERPVPNRYIVALEDRATPNARGLAEAIIRSHAPATIVSVYNIEPTGFAADMSDGIARALSHDPRVRFIEEAALGELSQEGGLSASGFQFTGTQNYNGVWHLDRIGQRTGLDGQYAWCSSGEGVLAYVLDTGVWEEHSEFDRLAADVDQSPRVLWGVDMLDNCSPRGSCSDNTGQCLHPNGCGQQRKPCGLSPTDLIGSHGTAVASVLGGLKFGVAKSVKIVPLRVVDCGGNQGVDSTYVLDGLNWILDPARNPNHNIRPAVANLSIYFAGSGQALLEEKIDRLIANGITVVAAANNVVPPSLTSPGDACLTSPARLGRPNGLSVSYNGSSHPPRVITVGGTGMANNFTTDTRWSGSNYGSCVSIMAPGEEIRSAQPDNNPYDPNHTRFERQTFRSGTSFSAPQVAGAVARYLQSFQGSNYAAANLSYAMPDQVWDYLDANASRGTPLIQNLMGSPDKLLWVPGGCRVRPAGSQETASQ